MTTRARRGPELGVPRGRPGEDPAGPRDGLRSPDAPPFHIYGAGHVLVLATGSSSRTLVWKDTALVRTGEVVDIVLDVTNPGHWVAHCHIAEHQESGMIFSFDVDE